MTYEMTRRNLLKGAAVLSVGAAVGLAGCAAPKRDSLSETGEAGDAAPEVVETYDCDLVVVGGGASGVACMAKATENGLKVLLLESTEAVGGATLAGVSTMFCLEDEFHGAIGMGGLTPGDLMAVEHPNSQYRTNGALWIKMMRESKDYKKWIEDNGGSFTPYAEVPPEWMAENQINCKNTFQLPPLIMAEGGDKQCVLPLHDAAVAGGAQVLLNTTATALIQDENGVVCGLYADTKEGPIQVNAKGVVMATGGFSNNYDMVKRQGFKDIDNVINVGMTYSNGFGVGEAIKAGGLDMIRESSPMSAACVEAFPGRFWSDPYNGNNGFAVFGKAVMVNQDGNRFVDEGFSQVNPLRQPMPVKENKRTYVIFDEPLFVEHFSPLFNAGDPSQVLADAVANGEDSLYKCDTAEDCAEAFGIDAATLKQTIDAYNDYARAGKDDEFGKNPELLQELTPPFYIGRVKSAVTNTLGGVATNDHFEVVDDEGEPVPGLYAVGVDGCMLYRNQYTVAVGAGTFSHNIFSGRRAADAAAKNILG